VAETPGGPEAVGRAILQEIREYSTGHVQVDDITLICFGPVAQS
jgi:phosphoserine phosphatase RsbU/P